MPLGFKPRLRSARRTAWGVERIDRIRLGVSAWSRSGERRRSRGAIRDAARRGIHAHDRFAIPCYS
jgi:hypothetical protein